MFWAKSTLLQSFCFYVAQVYVAITGYILLHQVERFKGKNSLREPKGILILIMILSNCSTLILIYDVLSSFNLYSV